MSPEVRRDDPPYVQIAEHIRADIQSGALPEGARIPSAREITATWGVALATATKVHALLRSEGLIRSVPGVGTVVSSSLTMFGGSQRLDSSGNRGRIYSIDERAEILSAELVEAPDDIADAIGIARGSQVIRRERVTRRRDELMSTSVSWFAGELAEMAPRLALTDRVPEGTFSYIGAQLGTQVVSGREQTLAAAATAEQAATLQIPKKSPVLLSQTWFYADDGMVIEFGESVHIGNRWLSHDFALHNSGTRS